jgi:hypothetical protein
MTYRDATREVTAWEEPRNDRADEVQWRFTTADV